jgi:uncharacterized protein (UPF0332 family)/predicted nucleotidyltransferase
MPDMPELPPDAKAKLEAIQKLLDKYKEKLLKKFSKYVIGIALMPPPRPEEGKKEDKDAIHVLVLVDDTDSQRLSKQELKDKLDKIIQDYAKEIDKNITPQSLLLSELWQSCFDAKYELLQIIAISAPIYDKGMLAAVKISEIHKTMVLKKFEKYIVSYVLSGSLVRGEATDQSDIDVMIIIDDTDVKKMTRAELKDKLRAIIIGMGIEAGEMTGVRNKLNIQVYILTDFWESLREANPIIFTLLRDGVPLYDRGMFMPWKQMLKMGKIKPSQEAIDLFMQSGDQMLKRVKFKLKEIGMEDTYYAILTPTQAALMLFGVAPPAPRETARLMREIFVNREKLIEDKYVGILERNIEIRKKLEHGTMEDISGKEIDELLRDADDYLKRIEKLFKQIEAMKEKESVLHIYESAVTVVRDVLKIEGITKTKDADILKTFESEVVHKGIIPEKYSRILKEIMKAKKDYDTGKLTKSDIDAVKKSSNELIRFMIEHIQRERGKELDRAKIRVKHGERFGEVILLDKVAFIVHDVEHEDKEISVADIHEDGTLVNPKPATLEQFEQALATAKIPPRTFIKEKMFEKLKEIFGKDVEILVNF